MDRGDRASERKRAKTWGDIGVCRQQTFFRLKGVTSVAHPDCRTGARVWSFRRSRLDRTRTPYIDKACLYQLASAWCDSAVSGCTFVDGFCGTRIASPASEERGLSIAGGGGSAKRGPFANGEEPPGLHVSACHPSGPHALQREKPGHTHHTHSMGVICLLDHSLAYALRFDGTKEEGQSRRDVPFHPFPVADHAGRTVRPSPSSSLRPGAMNCEDTTITKGSGKEGRGENQPRHIDLEQK